jgi:hypothetical protein
MMIAKNGHYQGRRHEDIVPGFKKYIDLVEDVAENGIKTPIKKVSDGCGYEIDGYHRLVIWKELGHDTIELDNG